MRVILAPIVAFERIVLSPISTPFEVSEQEGFTWGSEAYFMGDEDRFMGDE